MLDNVSVIYTGTVFPLKQHLQKNILKIKIVLWVWGALENPYDWILLFLAEEIQCWSCN